ncbi:hypothetical protein A2165_04295 [Candidatus Curtissbacteria bacterium RBG_13_40_7]|uniref:Uncharacterized protein n=1 Tax=Candidatus Curtissbacteria bacterium RBG_13_40_7 TaxID=1797706 RepID=A0A1F5FUR6_9BACT|nr:MAG: hypothetical protein A2165_04295 [Candidatus Curtissbacteria bacterium RBG_13_40_7]
MPNPERRVADNEEVVKQLASEAAIGINLLYSCNVHGNSIDQQRLVRGLEALANLPKDEFVSLIAQQGDKNSDG